jgi:SAM-dependent methyltransferase
MILPMHPDPHSDPDARHVRRKDYKPTVPAEVFIVPLLARLIEQALVTHAAPLSAGRAEGRDHARALDVGCGRQPFRTRLEQLGFAYTAQDVTQNPEGTVDVLCPIDRPVPEALTSLGPFQFILCTEVLEHVADWDAAFRNFRALLAPGGRMLITCPAVYPLHEEPFDFWRPTRYALRYYADRVGLRVVEQQAAGSGWDVLGTVLGGCMIRPRGPGTWYRFLRFGVAAVRRILIHVLRSGILQRFADLGGGVYLVNIAVLERPEVPEQP